MQLIPQQLLVSGEGLRFRPEGHGGGEGSSPKQGTLSCQLEEGFLGGGTAKALWLVAGLPSKWR